MFFGSLMPRPWLLPPPKQSGTLSLKAHPLTFQVDGSSEIVGYEQKIPLQAEKIVTLEFLAGMY